ncbi:DUF1592 domain-containing protein [Planctomycetes bacterium K23_9]|uniref:Planctomycete cytochrome C n=1 Tax=Stieleria marina TaxID=1930275 RepID=A0A517NXD3_9BACT|nr:hypothetical protein K239x_37690 [Planctomycetes bacterium K23_9]
MMSLAKRWWEVGCIAILAATVSQSAEIVSTEIQSPEISPALFLKTHCVRCHGAKNQEADRRFDGLGDEPTSVQQLESFKDALDQINLGEMPPEDEPQPTDADRIDVANKMQTILNSASKKLAGQSDATVLRRLNRFEYDRSVRQLLSLDALLIEPTDNFPPDETHENFRNNGESLVLSDFLLSRYLQASEKYLRAAVAPWTEPTVQSWTFNAPFYRTGNRHDGKDVPGKYQHIRKNYHDEGGFMWLSKFTKGVPISGRYKIRVKADGINRDYPYPESRLRIPKNDPIRMQVVAGNAAVGNLETTNASDKVIAEFELADHDPNGAPQWYEATVWLDQGFQPRIAYPNGPLGVKRFRQRLVREFPDRFKGYIDNWVPPYNNMHPTYDREGSKELIAAYRKKQKALKDAGKSYQIYGTSQSINMRDAWSQFYAEYDGPRVRVHEIQIEGPIFDSWPPAHHRRLFGTVRPSDKNAERLISRFAQRAFRRPVSDATLDSLLDLYGSERENGNEPLDAMLAAYQSVLCSPNFIFLHQGNDDLDAYDIASRLSYFLWSAPPDDALLAIAQDGSLLNSDTLVEQTRRMLADPRSEALVRQFPDAWLGLSKLGTMLPSQSAHPEYFVENLENAMRSEVDLFVSDAITNNRPITNFLDSDYTFVNGPLARLYGMEGIRGSQFQRVAISDRRRGGLLGMAGILTATANGIETSPVVRGVWVLESILGTPPSPPPPDVEPLEPDIRGAVSIRDQLQKHRTVATCNACHQKIDPLGFALESFDEIGRHRDRYHQSRTRVKVDTNGSLPSGESFKDIRDLKPLLMKQSDKFAKNLAKQMMSYATGRAPSVQDQLEAERIATSQPANELGLRSLIEQIVLSDRFRQ